MFVFRQSQTRCYPGLFEKENPSHPAKVENICILYRNSQNIKGVPMFPPTRLIMLKSASFSTQCAEKLSAAVSCNAGMRFPLKTLYYTSGSHRGDLWCAAFAPEDWFSRCESASCCSGYKMHRQ